MKVQVASMIYPFRMESTPMAPAGCEEQVDKGSSSWEEYVKALNIIFGANVYDDLMADLMNLKQKGTLQNYLEDFDVAFVGLHLMKISQLAAISMD